VNPKRRWYVWPNTVRIRVGAAYPLAGLGDGDRERVVMEVRTRVIELHRQLGGVGGDVAAGVASSDLAAIAVADRAGEVR
jgi:hypothetical protein